VRRTRAADPNSKYPIRNVFEGGCASPASGAARRLPLTATRNVRRFTAPPSGWPIVWSDGAGRPAGQTLHQHGFRGLRFLRFRHPLAIPVVR
jgi:hypothetical protein